MKNTNIKDEWAGLMELSVREIENKIIDLSGHRKGDQKDFDRKMAVLMMTRHNKLKKAFEYNNENAKRLIAFNDKLRNAELKLRDRLFAIRDELLRSHPRSHDEDILIEARVRLPYAYPEANPDQGKHAETLWETMINYCPDYASRHSGFHSIQFGEGEWKHADIPINEWLYLTGDGSDNWNEGLPLGWSSGMNLVYTFHQFYCHCGFALQDLIWVSHFEQELNVVWQSKL